jgi:DNA-binding CsgD family transcriptional regulator
VYITIEAARRSEVLTLLGRQYGLTPREQHVVSLVLGGLATRRIAERLGITQHTVQDHLKSIFDKTDVRSRRELAHRLALTVFGL